jgi:ribosomal protein S18 acetylase RimI-like enzyme
MSEERFLGTPFIIEKVKTQDIPIVLNLVRTQWPNFTDNDHETRDLWLVCKEGDLIVGTVSLDRETESGYVFLQDIIVEKGHRRKGIGKELVRKSIEIFLMEGETLMALVSTMNRNAIKFYEKIGFKKYPAGKVKANSPIGQKPHNKNCMAWGYEK